MELRLVLIYPTWDSKWTFCLTTHRLLPWQLCQRWQAPVKFQLAKAHDWLFHHAMFWRDLNFKRKSQLLERKRNMPTMNCSIFKRNLQEVEASLKVTRMELAHVSLCWSILQKPRKEGKSFKEEKRSISLNLQEWALGVIWMYKNLGLPFLIWVFSHCTIIASCELTCFWVKVSHFAAFFCWC
jgi:hypothetical protein